MKLLFKQWRMKFLYGIFLCFVLYFLLVSKTITDKNVKLNSTITYFSDVYVTPKREQTFLMWKPFLSNDFILKHFTTALEQCSHNCSVTDDKTTVDTVDAVIFHQFDLWPREVNWDIGTRVTIELPKRRRYEQIWALWNMEPPVNIFGDFSALNGVFNWTVWYRRDATFWWPYGAKAELTETETRTAADQYKTRNFYQEKAKGICGRISNCADPALRYKLVQELQDYLDIDMFGGCYGTPASDEELVSYKFYLAFENSNCKDYVTEKYWGALYREQIPIVNWRYGMSPDIVIPGSCINVYDFPTVKQAAQYIYVVSKNETLFNSYFKWKLKYVNRASSTICSLCKALHTRSVPSQVYNRLDIWLKNDTCPQVTYWSSKLGYFFHSLWEYGLW